MTLSYVAKPRDSRCRWWSVHLPATFAVSDLDDRESMRSLGFVRKNADIELDEGDAVIDSEERHHRKQRGYRVRIGIVTDGELTWREPGAITKQLIKQWATPEQWALLRKGSGDVAACLRLFMAWQMGFRYPSKPQASEPTVQPLSAVAAQVPVDEALAAEMITAG